jgi:hypothetical protein
MCTWTALIIHFSPFKSIGTSANGFTGIKNVLVNCLFIVSWSWILYCLQVFPTVKNLNDWGQVNMDVMQLVLLCVLLHTSCTGWLKCTWDLLCINHSLPPTCSWAVPQKLSVFGHTFLFLFYLFIFCLHVGISLLHCIQEL